MHTVINVPKDVPLDEYVISHLNDNGFPGLGVDNNRCVYFRFFSKDTLPKILETGTDRDDTSSLWLEGEQEAMVKAGLKPGDITYVGNYMYLRSHKNLKTGEALVVYDSSRLQKVLGGPFFWSVKKPYTFLDAMVEVFSSEE